MHMTDHRHKGKLFLDTVRQLVQECDHSRRTWNTYMKFQYY